MGIKYLNKYLTKNCKSIKRVHLKTLKNKTIVIDTSIYMYKFLSENALLENMQKMINTFRQYNITPVFIFDGKPPPEKKELMNQRYLMKCKAKEKYEEMSKRESPDQQELLSLKNQFLKITETDVVQVKELFDSMDVRYFVSTTESDPVCVYLVNSNKVFACLTEDMDMFVYGCKKILRDIDLTLHEIQYYDVDSILKELRLTLNEFKEILVLSGTDYNIKNTNNLYLTMNLFDQYKKKNPHCGPSSSFYKWLSMFNPQYIEDKVKLNTCLNMFDLQHYSEYLKPFTQLQPADLLPTDPLPAVSAVACCQ
jgi:hypothetical protein